MAVHVTGAAGLLALLSGCAGSPAGTTLTQSLSTPPKPPAASIEVTPSTVPPIGASPSVTGSAIAVYERVARRALGCWFGGLGPLKKTHIFNANVAPPSAGGAAEIFIHEREANPMPNQTPRGAKVFRIAFDRESDERTRVIMEAGKLPPDLGIAMQKDVVAWANDKDQCEAQIARLPPPPPPQPDKSKVKKRAKTAAR